MPERKRSTAGEPSDQKGRSVVNQFPDFLVEDDQHADETLVKTMMKSEQPGGNNINES